MKKTITVLLVYTMLCFILLGCVSCSKTESIEEGLLGEWKSTSEKGEAFVEFYVKDESCCGRATFFDYSKNEWGTSEFIIKEINSFIMTILTPDGKIEYITFAASKDTLVFDNVIYTQSGKNIQIPEGIETYIVDGKIMPVMDGLFFGMSKEEVEIAVQPKTLTQRFSNEYFYPVDEDDYPVKVITLQFNNSGYLDTIELFLDNTNYNSVKNTAIDACSDIYGEYTKTEWSTQKDYYDYKWFSGNMIIELTDANGEYLQLSYMLDFDWVIDQRTKK